MSQRTHEDKAIAVARAGWAIEDAPAAVPIAFLRELVKSNRTRRLMFNWDPPVDWQEATAISAAASKRPPKALKSKCKNGFVRVKYALSGEAAPHELLRDTYGTQGDWVVIRKIPRAAHGGNRE